ncbi:MAG TPA: BREX system ATP-binding domain-containing protein [Stellaceae bacterium]|nr:BREX system ATP-binding domain-containing protein [Stellaceae bacterium]
MNAAALDARRAIEALRAGVPNRAAIRLLGTNNNRIAQDFLARLRLCGAALSDRGQVDGIVINGGFGTGKSHQLGYLGELAQQDNFIVSLVPISKETPLFDPARLFAAAIRAAFVPDANDDVMTAVMNRLHPNSERYDALEAWTTGEVAEGRLSALFAALLYLIPRRQTDPGDLARIARFFAGAKLNIGVVKSWLREAGATRLFPFARVREADLAVQRLRFAPRLFVAGGYSGWCVLLDEVELIGRYTPLQRGRSYAELVRWLGSDREFCLPGVVTVAAVTDDFADQMFDRKRDDELVPPRLEQRGLSQGAAMARIGIARLRQQEYTLSPPDESSLRRSLDRIGGLYRDAYGWAPPDAEIGHREASRSMRQYVKSWITGWDIERLYGETAQIKAGTIPSDYSESDDIERAPIAGEDDYGAG